MLPEDYDFPSKLGELGQTEDESSYIAVVHIDGNRMSSKIASFNNKMKRQEGETGEEFDARYIQGLRELSSEIDQKYKEAFRELIGMIIKNMDKLKETLDLSGNCLPIRPLIMAVMISVLLQKEGIGRRNGDNEFSMEKILARKRGR